MLMFDEMGRCIGEHVCNPSNRHLCLAATKRAKAQAQTVAFTTSHPAYRVFLALTNHLTPQEEQWVDAELPGNGRIP